MPESDGIPAGWADWYGADTPTKSWTLNENGSIKTYPQDPSVQGYETWEDVMGDKALKFVAECPRLGQAVLPLVRHPRPTLPRARPPAR